MEQNLVVQYFEKGGWIMFPILLTSIVALAVIVGLGALTDRAHSTPQPTPYSYIGG